MQAYLKVKEGKVAQSEQGKNDDGNNITVYGGTADVQSAFRLVPLNKRSWKWLIMKVKDPRTKKWKFFVDKCLPFGASISCAIFQRISDALKFLFEYQTNSWNTVTNYLDDFPFLALTILRCNELLSEFHKMCSDIGIPLSDEKTKWANDLVIFLELLLDGRRFIIRIPLEKRRRAIMMLNNMIAKKKAMVGELQELCRYLNFLCCAIFPGRPFIRLMYAKYSDSIVLPYPIGGRKPEANKTILKKYYHVRLDSEFKSDCKIWLAFLDDHSQLNEIVKGP